MSMMPQPAPLAPPGMAPSGMGAPMGPPGMGMPPAGPPSTNPIALLQGMTPALGMLQADQAALVQQQQAAAQTAVGVLLQLAQSQPDPASMAAMSEPAPVAMAAPTDDVGAMQ